jgi:hypothetical protein
MTTITFTEQGSLDCRVALNALAGWTIRGDFSSAGYPADAVICDASEDGLKVFEADETGAPVTNATWVVPWECVDGITVA